MLSSPSKFYDIYVKNLKGWGKWETWWDEYYQKSCVVQCKIIISYKWRRIYMVRKSNWNC